MSQDNIDIGVFHLISAQVIIAECTQVGTIHQLVNPHEMIAIPPSQEKPTTSFAMTPFGSFYGMLPPAAKIFLDHTKYLYATILPKDDPIRQFYINSLNKGESA